MHEVSIEEPLRAELEFSSETRSLVIFGLSEGLANSLVIDAVSSSSLENFVSSSPQSDPIAPVSAQQNNAEGSLG